MYFLINQWRNLFNSAPAQIYEVVWNLFWLFQAINLHKIFKKLFTPNFWLCFIQISHKSLWNCEQKYVRTWKIIKTVTGLPRKGWGCQDIVSWWLFLKWLSTDIIQFWPTRNPNCKKMHLTNSVQSSLKSHLFWEPCIINTPFLIITLQE